MSLYKNERDLPNCQLSIYGDFAYSIEKVREDAMDKYLLWVQNEAFSKLTPGEKNG